MALAYPAMLAAGIGGAPALFISAALTATSVGITARVFGDLRALATPEARVVLGAAVADDIAGLVALTVVSGVVAGERVTPLTVAAITAGAVGFVIAATVVGTATVPKFLGELERRSRADGTVMAFALALAPGFASLAEAVRLAPIVGAFVAGLAVGRSEVAEELHSRLVPLGHFFVPVFFLKVGVEAELGVFRDSRVLALAAVIFLIAVAGKLVAGAGAGRRRGNRLVVGVAMVPRGEVGLIFASLGLRHGVLDPSTYGALVAVILASTVITPPWLCALLVRGRRRRTSSRASTPEPEGGWLIVDDRTVDLAAEPPPYLAGRIGLEAKPACSGRNPGGRLREWLAEVEPEPVLWDESTRRSLVRLLAEGTERSWRLLEASGLEEAVFGELALALRRRPRDPFDLEATAGLYPASLRELRRALSESRGATAFAALARPDLVLISALTREAFAGRDEAARRAYAFASSIGLDHLEAQEVSF